MSSNNQVRIRRSVAYIVEDVDVEHPTEGTSIAETKTLEDAIEEANRYMLDNPVEYGLDIKL